jgi:hypothetical protein
MNGVPLVGQQQHMLAPCPGPAPHIAVKPEDPSRVILCRFCGGYGHVLVNPRRLKILDIRDDAPQAVETADEAAAH